MLVLIRTIKGDTFKIPVELDTTVRQMKDLISEAASLSSSDMKIVHKAVVLQDDMIFSNINFKENDFFVAQFLKSKNSPKKNIQSLISTDVQIPEPESPQTIHTATDQQVQTENCPLEEDESDDDNVDDEISDSELRQLFSSNPETFLLLVSRLDQVNPESAARIRSDPEMYLRNLGLNPDLFNLDAIRNGASVPVPTSTNDSQPRANHEASRPPARSEPQQTPINRWLDEVVVSGETENEVLNSLSDEERGDVQQLCDMGFELKEVLQAYLRSKKNPNVTANLLIGLDE